MAENPYQSPQLVRTPKGVWRAFWRRVCFWLVVLATVDAMLLVAIAVFVPASVPAVLFAVVNFSTPALWAVVFVTAACWMLSAQPE